MIAYEYDIFGEKVLAIYDLFLRAIAGRYQQIVSTGAKPSPFVVKEFVADSKAIGNTFIAMAEAEANKYLCSLNVDQTEMDSSDLRGALKLAVSANVAQLTKQIRTGATDYKKMLGNAHGSIGQLVQRKIGTVDFKLYDTADRRWNAQKLVRMVARDFAYQNYVTHTVKQLVGEGYAIARIIYDDPTKADREMTINLEYGFTPDVMRKVFHQNATARIVPHV